MKGYRLRNIVVLFLLVLMGASVLVAHVWKQNAYVRLSKEAVKLNRAHKALRDSIALLEMEAGELRNLARIESLARERFGLEYGNQPILVYPESAGEAGEEEAAEAVAGRTGEERTGNRSGAQAERAAWPTRGL